MKNIEEINQSIVKKIVSEIIKLDPSFLIIGGDLIDSSSFKIEDLKEFKKLIHRIKYGRFK